MSAGAAPTPIPTTRSRTCPLFDSTTTIYVPRLNVRAPVYDCDTAADGQLPIAHGYAVTHWYSSAGLGAAGNYVLYGHDDIEGQIFRYLPSMQAGDEVYLYEGGRDYVYTVTRSLIVAPTDTSVLYSAPSAPAATLTLISCYPYWVDSQRIVVKAALTRVGGA